MTSWFSQSLKSAYSKTPMDKVSGAGTGGGRGQLPPCPFARGRGGSAARLN